MRTEELLEHADYLLGAAAGKCDSWDDAQDLVQAVLLEGLLAVRSGKKIDNARNWLVTVLNRRFYDMLREKYRKPLVFWGRLTRAGMILTPMTYHHMMHLPACIDHLSIID